MSQNLAHHLRLMLVTDDGWLAGRDLVEVCQAAVRGGVTAVQVRLKRESARRLLALVREVQAAVRVPVVVNDRPDVARAAGAWVHLGPDDLAIDVARRLFPGGGVIGASVGSASEAGPARSADYWGIGPWRETSTKRDAGSALAAPGFGRLVGLANGKPCLAIGGVLPEDLAAVRATGGVGVAVASGILRHADVEAAAGRYAVAVQREWR